MDIQLTYSILLVSSVYHSDLIFYVLQNDSHNVSFPFVYIKNYYNIIGYISYTVYYMPMSSHDLIYFKTGNFFLLNLFTYFVTPSPNQKFMSYTWICFFF